MKAPMQAQVNFIKHLDVFLEIVGIVDAVNFTHIAVYLSLFRIWNLSFFTNPISPVRDDIMKYAGLKSKESFYRIIREMESLDLIRYYPSSSKYEKSFYCLSHLEIEEGKIKITVFSLTNHKSFSQNPDLTIVQNEGGTLPKDIRSKANLFNGKGSIVISKTIYLKDSDLEDVVCNPSTSTYNPHTDPKYASQLDHRISSHSNNSNYANHQNSQSRGSSLRPSGVQIDPEADYSIKL
jgi:PPE-repeat protein